MYAKVLEGWAESALFQELENRGNHRKLLPPGSQLPAARKQSSILLELDAWYLPRPQLFASEGR